MDLATMVAAVRVELKDTDASAERWTDEELEQHIGRAAAEYSVACPRVCTVDKVAGTSASYDLSAEAGYMYAIEAEYPPGESLRKRIGVYEPAPGNVWLMLPSGELPPTGDTVRFYYAGRHEVGMTSSSVPPEHEGLIRQGACAYALAAMAVYAIDRISTSGKAGLDWARLSSEAVQAYRAELAKVARRASAGLASWGSHRGR